MIRTAEIICVGTELLVGQTLNTNAHFLAKQLNMVGVACYHQVVVGDNSKRLSEALRLAASRADLLILTGGLGPTADDITMQVVAETFGKELQFDGDALGEIKRYFDAICQRMSDNNLKQAMLPAGCRRLTNDNGTAPGAIFAIAPEKYAMVLPGPPNELQPMFINYALPWLSEQSDRHFVHHYFKFCGIGEAPLEQSLRDLIDTQEQVTMATYIAGPEVMLRLTEWSEQEREPSAKLQALCAEVRKRLGAFIFCEDQRTLVQVVADKLREKQHTVAVAESCTAGMVCSKFAEVSGISRVLLGGIVAYNNHIKHELLGISTEVLDSFGAVSEECAKAMAENVKAKFSADIGLAVTGIAGPTGGSQEKPVGLVYIAVATEKEIVVNKLRLQGERNKIREVATIKLLDLLRKQISEE